MKCLPWRRDNHDRNETFNAVLSNRGSLSSDGFHAADRRPLIAAFRAGKNSYRGKKLYAMLYYASLGARPRHNILLVIKI